MASCAGDTKEATTGFFGSSRKPNNNNNMLFEETEAEPTGPDLRPDTELIWYWEEDGHRVKNHHTWDKQGNFIAYPPKVSTYLEQQWTTASSRRHPPFLFLISF